MARNISELHPRLQEAVRKLKEKFPSIGIGECFRSVSEQDALYAKGRTVPGSIVTNAKGSTYSSQHQWGIAVDFFYNVKGQEFSDRNYFKKVGQYAKTIGLAWGGDWTSPVDMPHLYLPDWGETPAALKKQYGTFENFRKTWDGSENQSTPNPSTGGYSGSSIVDYLRSIGKDSSFSARKEYALQYGISNYAGTAEQNIKLLNAMRGKIQADSPASDGYCKAFISNSIVDGLKSINVDSSMANRKKIAAANGISGYVGTSAQNTKLLNLARQGRLKKV